MGFGFTRQQAKAMGQGYKEALNRVKDTQTIFVKITMPIQQDPNHILHEIRSIVPIEITPVALSSITPESRVSTYSEDALEKTHHKMETDYLRKEIAKYQEIITELRAGRDPEDVKKPEQPITLTEFARKHNMAYSTAYRAMKAGRIQSKVLHDGDHCTYLVYASTYQPAAKKKSSRKH